MSTKFTGFHRFIIEHKQYGTLIKDVKNQKAMKIFSILTEYILIISARKYTTLINWLAKIQTLAFSPPRPNACRSKITSFRAPSNHFRSKHQYVELGSPCFRVRISSSELELLRIHHSHAYQRSQWNGKSVLYPRLKWDAAFHMSSNPPEKVVFTSWEVVIMTLSTFESLWYSMTFPHVRNFLE